MYKNRILNEINSQIVFPTLNNYDNSQFNTYSFIEYPFKIILNSYLFLITNIIKL